MNKQVIIGDGSEYINTLVSAAVPHRLIYTNNSVRVQIGENDIVFSNKLISMRDLGFIGRCKDDVIKNSEILHIPERHPIFYKIYPMKYGHYCELYEIDISSAFWDTAFREGIISERIFLQGETVKKDVRLMAFGAAATVRRTFDFDGRQYVSAGEEVNDAGRRAYFYVASRVVSAMREVCEAIPGQACLYWVDAIVCTPQYKDYVCGRLFSQGWQIKTKRLTDCRHFLEKGAAKVWAVTEAETGRKKEFREFPRKNKNRVSALINTVFENKTNFL